jgi:hypothetical protein
MPRLRCETCLKFDCTCRKSGAARAQQLAAERAAAEKKAAAKKRGRDPLGEVLEAIDQLADAPRSGDTVRVKLPGGRVITRRVKGHLHFRAGELSIEVNGATYASSRAAVKLEVHGFAAPLVAHKDRDGWYVDASAGGAS